MAFVQKNRTASYCSVFECLRAHFCFLRHLTTLAARRRPVFELSAWGPIRHHHFTARLWCFHPKPPLMFLHPLPFVPCFSIVSPPPPPHLLQVSNRCQRWTTSLWGSLYKSVTDVMLHNCGPRYDVMVAFVSCQIHVKSVTVTCC